MSTRNRALCVAAVMTAAFFHTPSEAQEKITLSSLTAQGFEIKTAVLQQSNGVMFTIVQKGKDVFVCLLIQKTFDPKNMSPFGSACSAAE